MLINIKRFIIKFPIVGNINTSADYWTVSVLVGNATINYTKTVSSGICLGEFKSVIHIINTGCNIDDNIAGHIAVMHSNFGLSSFKSFKR